MEQEQPSEMIRDNPVGLFVGKLGKSDLVEVNNIPYISNLDGEVGLPLDELGELANNVGEDGVLWIRRRGSGENSEIDVNDSLRSFAKGNVVLDLTTREFSIDGESVLLTPHEFGLLELLSRNPEYLVSIESIKNEIWNGPTSYHNVVALVKYLRVKLGKYAWIVKNRHGQGYVIDDRRPPEETNP